MMRRPPKFVQGFIDRHGKPRFYIRRAGYKRVPLPGLPWSPEFMAAHEAALGTAAPQQEIGASRTMPGTINALVVNYYKSGYGCMSSKRIRARPASASLSDFAKSMVTSGLPCFAKIIF